MEGYIDMKREAKFRFARKKEAGGGSSSEEQDDIMSIDEEAALLNRFKRSHSVHGARRKSLDGLPSGQWSRRASLVGNKFLSKDDQVKLKPFCLIPFL